jgi:hypothetical protein
MTIITIVLLQVGQEGDGEGGKVKAVGIMVVEAIEGEIVGVIGLGKKVGWVEYDTGLEEVVGIFVVEEGEEEGVEVGRLVGRLVGILLGL